MSRLPVPRRASLPAKLSPLQAYLNEIARYPLLAPEEELELAKKHYEEQDVASARRLVTANLRLVVKIAGEFNQAQISMLDLIQEGNTGLMQAVKKFNPYKGVKLSSYAAWWIKAYILKYILDNKSLIKIATTATQRKLYYNLEKVRRKLLNEFDEVDNKLIAEALQVKEKDVEEMQKRLASTQMPIDETGGATSDDGASKATVIPAQDPSVEESLVDRQMKKLFSSELKEYQETLKDRDYEIFRDRMMADEPITLQEIGDKYGISRERARQLEVKILKNLKKFISSRGVIDIEAD